MGFLHQALTHGLICFINLLQTFRNNLAIKNTSRQQSH
jgi:hypothetical protein